MHRSPHRVAGRADSGREPGDARRRAPRRRGQGGQRAAGGGQRGGRDRSPRRRRYPGLHVGQSGPAGRGPAGRATRRPRRAVRRRQPRRHQEHPLRPVPARRGAGGDRSRRAEGLSGRAARRPGAGQDRLGADGIRSLVEPVGGGHGGGSAGYSGVTAGATARGPKRRRGPGGAGGDPGADRRRRHRRVLRGAREGERAVAGGAHHGDVGQCGPAGGGGRLRGVQRADDHPLEGCEGERQRRDQEPALGPRVQRGARVAGARRQRAGRRHHPGNRQARPGARRFDGARRDAVGAGELRPRRGDGAVGAVDPDAARQGGGRFDQQCPRDHRDLQSHQPRRGVRQGARHPHAAGIDPGEDHLRGPHRRGRAGREVRPRLPDAVLQQAGAAARSAHRQGGGHQRRRRAGRVRAARQLRVQRGDRGPGREFPLRHRERRPGSGEPGAQPDLLDRDWELRSHDVPAGAAAGRAGRRAGGADHHDARQPARRNSGGRPRADPRDRRELRDGRSHTTARHGAVRADRHQPEGDAPRDGQPAGPDGSARRALQRAARVGGHRLHVPDAAGGQPDIGERRRNGGHRRPYGDRSHGNQVRNTVPRRLADSREAVRLQLRAGIAARSVDTHYAAHHRRPGDAQHREVTRSVLMQQMRGVREWCALVALAGVVGACETARNPGGVLRDQITPTITLVAASDTQQISNGLSFTVAATDNLGLKDVRLTYSDPSIAQSDSIFTSAVTTFSQSEHITFPPTSGAGGFITIIGRATDGAGNFAEDTIVIFLSNVQALSVTLVAPTAPAVASSGKNIPVEVHAQQLGGLERIGFIITPRARQPPDTFYTDTLTVQPGFTTFTVTGFAVDAGGRRAFSNTVTVTVQTPGNDVTPPTVSHMISSRVEVNDNVAVHATDPSGIKVMGFRVDTALAAVPPFTGVTPLKFVLDSTMAAGNLTTVDKVFALALPLADSGLPKSVVIRGYACDLAVARNCAYSQTSTVIVGSPARRAAPMVIGASGGVDTVVVVAGTTHSLPFGGHIADAIYNSNRRELYLTNDALGRVEVYKLATNTLDPTGIITAGPVPWGIALWPVDTLGTYDPNRVVVADAGGTELSILDASTRRLLWRQALPNFLIEKYSIQIVANFIRAVITVHDVSDRPQYLGTVCRVTSGGSTCNADSIYAIYSTTPTQSSSSPFSGRATLRMEKLINSTDTTQLFGHLFWELGALGQNVTGDTLRIVLIRPTQGQSKVVLTACRQVTIDFGSFGLGDQTFVRNTGNFTHAFVGEGGSNIELSSARVFAYSAKKQLIRPANSCTMGGAFGIPESGNDDQDFGMSPGVHG